MRQEPYTKALEIIARANPAQAVPDWPPADSAVGMRDGIHRFGSTGQEFCTASGRWVRVPERMPLTEVATLLEDLIQLSGAALLNNRVWQDWTCKLPMSMQTVLAAAIRGPDGIRKDCMAKVIVRMLRRSLLKSARDRRALDLVEPGGGEFMMPLYIFGDGGFEKSVRDVVTALLHEADELPHHFQAHLMHAAQIVGYLHPNDDQQGIDKRWAMLHVYERMVDALHLNPETVDEMLQRYSHIDNKPQEPTDG